MALRAEVLLLWLVVKAEALVKRVEARMTDFIVDN
jgi:hypothetical protein